MKKKILFLTIGSYVGGLEIVTLHLIRKLKAEGHELKCLVTGWNDGRFIRELEELGVPYETVKLGWLYLRKPLWTLDSLVHLPGAYLKCRRILREFRPDVLHYCNFYSVILLYPLLKRWRGVYPLHEEYEPNRKNRIIFKIMNKRVDVFIAISEYIRQALIRLDVPKEKISLVYNGVPPVPHRRLKPEEEKLVFAIIGAVAPWKGHDTLVDAVDLLKGARRRPFVVKVFGNDKNAYAEELRKKIAAKGLDPWFEWEGFVREQQAIYEKVDVVVVPSTCNEACPLATLEAMMWGKNLIGSDRGAIPELVTDRTTGLVFAAEDPNQLKECLQLYLDRDAATAPLAGQAYERAMQTFTEDRMTAGYSEIYSRLAPKKV